MTSIAPVRIVSKTNWSHLSRSRKDGIVVRVRRVQRGFARDQSAMRQRQIWQTSTPSSASRPSSRRIGSLPPTLQRYTEGLGEFVNFTKLPLNELQLVKNLDGMAVEMLEHLHFQGYGNGSGKFLMAAIKFVGWIQNFAGLPRAMRALKGVVDEPQEGLGGHCHG